MNDTQKAIIETIPENYRDRVTSEANIRWGMNGGAFSGYLSQVATQVKKALAAGNEPSFPSIEWNRKMIEENKRRRCY